MRMRNISSTYSMTRPFVKGVPTKYFVMCAVLDAAGPLSKTELLKAVGDKNRPGYLTTTFSAMRESGLIDYNPRTKKLEIGPNWEIFKRSNLCVRNTK